MKIRILFLIIFLPYILYSQPQYGDGSAGDPYRGTITTPWTLSGDKYCGDLTVSSGTFTISAGSTLRFGSGNSLTISGTGVLHAIGTASEKITFTASGTSWGHIYFESTGDLSTIEYCIIENGNSYYGGGIHIKSNNVLINHTIIRNCNGRYGGGIFSDDNISSLITNTYFYNNTATRSGGGCYFWNSNTSILYNCIFDSNRSLEITYEFYTGGALAAQSNCRIKISNTTFINNTSTQPLGQSILFYGSSSSNKMINCIVWGSTDNHFYLQGSNIINYCAVEGSAPSGTGNFILSSNNNAPTGPNFTDPSSSDWSLQFISPCRDAGINSYTGVTIPSQDYLGNNRIGTTDIGAYEVQYSRWKTDPSDIYTWTAPGNWEQGLYPGHSNATGDIVLPPLLSSTSAPSVSSVTISSGKYMILEPGAKASIGTINNSGNIVLQSDATNVSSLIVDNFSGNPATFNLYLSGGGAPNYKWHYISSPVTSLSTDPFTDVTDNLAQYIEDRPTNSLLEGWVAYDGYIYSTGSTGGPTFNSLTTGKGYNFYDNTDNTVNFSGTPNTGDIVVNLTYGGNPSLHGFNLLGNPYPSGLNWDDIVDEIYYDYPSNTSKGLYFTRNNQQCSYINGIGIPEDVTGIIPPMQGFFIKTYSTGNSITIPFDSRVHDNIHQRYKGSQIIPLVRLAIKENDQWKDETVIRFDEKARQELDYDFDAVKMFISPDNVYIYTTSGETKYAINGQPVPQGGSSSFLIPVTVNVISDNVEYSLTSPQIKGLPPDVKVFFKDDATGFTADLTEGSLNYKFSAPAGLINDRFSIAAIATGSELINETRDGFIIYPAQGSINIIPLSELWEGRNGTVRIFDITGKVLLSRNNIIFSKNSEIKVNAPDKPGVYIINIRSNVLNYTGRFIIK